MRDVIALKANGKMSFNQMYNTLAGYILNEKPFDRGEVHAQKTTTPEMITKEIRDVVLDIEVPDNMNEWQDRVTPNLPWAEDHFQERVSGQPLNPPPSEQWWPFAQHGNSDHKQDEKFSHTYPERFWPRFANEGGTMLYSGRVVAVPQVGIRYEWGDLADLINLLKKNRRTRQAYLPIWFPEDLNAANHGDRVPCTLGYHFLLNHLGQLDMTYPMRSCDLVRFFRDDVYMAGRLLQWVGDRLSMHPGKIRMNIANLHAFVGDEAFLRPLTRGKVDVRASYNFDAL